MHQLNKLILNSITFIAVLVINYLSGAGLFGEYSIGGVSDLYPTAITPAGYAFSIWGLIYLLLSFFTGYQWYTWKNGNSKLIDAIGYFFILSNLANIFWVIAWVNNQIALSLLLLIVLLFSLYKLVLKLNLEKWNAPPAVILFVWWPITIYLGWIILATVLNVKVLMVSTGYADILWDETIWGVVLLVLSTIVYLYLIHTRNLREAGLVGVWGFISIAYQQSEKSSAVLVTALSSSILLLVYVIYHAYRNRKENSLFPRNIKPKLKMS